jgi:hypothetical protein
MSETERSGKRKRAKRWSAAEAREVVKRWRESGQSAAAFASEQHISATRLAYWSKQLELQAEQSPQFVAVTMPAEPSTMHRVEIAVGGLTLRVREGVGAGFIAQLVSALQGHVGERSAVSNSCGVLGGGSRARDGAGAAV